ncbi:hypothetical protein [Actinoplanes sp. NPDC026619]|uniref:hypothetical protein n=1 Tax=Actinoplanes sp. NPDC026619 TaxID=3155798 RepID=UPI0033C0193B
MADNPPGGDAPKPPPPRPPEQSLKPSPEFQQKLDTFRAQKEAKQDTGQIADHREAKAENQAAREVGNQTVPRQTAGEQNRPRQTASDQTTRPAATPTGEQAAGRPPATTVRPPETVVPRPGDQPAGKPQAVDQRPATAPPIEPAGPQPVANEQNRGAATETGPAAETAKPRPHADQLQTSGDQVARAGDQSPGDKGDPVSRDTHLLHEDRLHGYVSLAWAAIIGLLAAETRQSRRAAHDAYAKLEPADQGLFLTYVEASSIEDAHPKLQS